MITTITQYETSDGKKWNTIEEAENREKRIDIENKIYDILGGKQSIKGLLPESIVNLVALNIEMIGNLANSYNQKTRKRIPQELVSDIGMKVMDFIRNNPESHKKEIVQAIPEASNVWERLKVYIKASNIGPSATYKIIE